MKYDEVHLANYETYLDALENLPSINKEVYNEKRVHSEIDYITPASELEEKIKLDPTMTSRLKLQLLKFLALQFTAHSPVEAFKFFSRTFDTKQFV